MEFVQEPVATLHGLTEHAPAVPLDDVAVVIPVMGRDLEGSSLDRILGILGDVDPGRVLLSVRGSWAAVSNLHERLGDRAPEPDVLWCNAPALEERLAEADLDGPAGKGRDVWLALAVAGATHDTLVVHDADAHTYTRDHVPRLAWAIDRGFDFVKAYYARIERERFFGRLVRLVWYPILATLTRQRSDPFVRYLDAFRYPLAGEFAVRSDQVRDLRLQPRWGLETGMLGEMFRTVGLEGSAQVDLGVHRHDHRPLHGGEGLGEMAAEVIGTLGAMLTERDIALPSPEAYEAAATDHVERYAADAAFNGLRYDREDELGQVRRYRTILEEGGRRFAPLPALSSLSLDPADIRRLGQPANRRRRVS